MTGPQADEVDWESMTNKELHDKFQHMLGQQVEDIMASFGKELARIDDVEKIIDAKLDAKFDEVLARLPQPPPASAPPLQQQQQQQQQQPPPRRETAFRRAGRVPLELGQHSGAAATTVDASVAPAATAEVEDYYEDEVDENQNYVQPPPPPPGRPQAYNRNGRAAPPPQVRDYDHIPKLKLNIPPFDGRYIPDVYLTWELETEQRFTCLQYPEDRRVAAAVCEFTSFASIWWSEHCRLYHGNIPTTWAALKTAMRTRWVPPYYQRELLQKLQRLRQGKNSVEEYYQELQTGMIRCGIVEDNEAMLARFMGGLNREIQTIPSCLKREVQDHNITRLFHLACKAE